MWENYNHTDFNDFSMSSLTSTILSKEVDENMVFNIKDFMENAKIHIRFLNKSKNEDPKYAHEGDSGFDLRADLKNFDYEYAVIGPGERKLIPTGLHFELPEGYELQIRPRSGLANKYGVVPSFGTVDYGYRGELFVNLFNFGNENFTIYNGDRIAQGVLVPRLSTEFGKLEKVEQLTETNRGSGGFGSTGHK